MVLFFKILFKDLYHLLRTRNSRVFLKLAFRYGDAKRYRPKTVAFFNYTMDVPDCQSFLWQFKEIFADENYRFQADTDTPLIYDCGANIGLDALYFKRLYPKARIKAFEADPAIAALLQKNLHTNGFTDVQVVGKAVWIADTTVSFASEGADGGAMTEDTGQMRVPAIRLKDWLLAEERIDLLKMDIEGAETAVIRDCGDALQRVKNIFIEYHAYVGQPQALDEILRILGGNGFRYFIRSEADRKQPFVNRTNRKTPAMDLQLNIFAYR